MRNFSALRPGYFLTHYPILCCNAEAMKPVPFFVVASTTLSVLLSACDRAPEETVAAPTPLPTPIRHLTAEGVFYVVQYVTARTSKGPIGFEPGREVFLVKPLVEKGVLLVSDGKYQAEIAPRYLTNDIDIADVARRLDEAGQSAINDFQDRSVREFQAAQEKFNVASADRIHAAEVERNKASAVGGLKSRLNEPARRTSSWYGDSGWYVTPNSPYSYFVNPPTSSLQRVGGG